MEKISLTNLLDTDLPRVWDYGETLSAWSQDLRTAAPGLHAVQQA
jgi:hypothetical protein